ncbi:hypothetical protein HOY82DRAFT_607145 [Tuber indicum]|nr:hypothetical protein HOY82DRAFT_607145 [Tuber indicum]
MSYQNTRNERNNDGNNSSKEEIGFEVRGRQLGELKIADILENQDIADYEEAQNPDQRELQQNHNLPQIPPFQPYEHSAPRYDRILHLPLNLSGQYDPIHNPNPRPIRPIDFFMLFFDTQTMQSLASNTNQYAIGKRASREHSRR